MALYLGDKLIARGGSDSDNEKYARRDVANELSGTNTFKAATTFNDNVTIATAKTLQATDTLSAYNGTLTAANLVVNSTTNLKGATTAMAGLSVTGTTALNGTTTAANLTVNGTTNLNGTTATSLAVNGATTLNGNATVASGKKLSATDTKTELADTDTLIMSDSTKSYNVSYSTLSSLIFEDVKKNLPTDESLDLDSFLIVGSANKTLANVSVCAFRSIHDSKATIAGIEYKYLPSVFKFPYLNDGTNPVVKIDKDTYINTNIYAMSTKHDINLNLKKCDIPDIAGIHYVSNDDTYGHYITVYEGNVLKHVFEPISTLKCLYLIYYNRILLKFDTNTATELLWLRIPNILDNLKFTISIDGTTDSISLVADTVLSRIYKFKPSTNATFGIKFTIYYNEPINYTVWKNFITKCDQDRTKVHISGFSFSLLYDKVKIFK